jgi:hypothetical protein
MSTVNLRVNGKAHTVDVDPRTPLLYVLRNDLDLHGPRFGCGLGQCGACTVIINGAAVRSCTMPVSTVRGEITTLEGLATDGTLHPIQQAWVAEQVPACGFCQNGPDSRREGAARSQSPSHRCANPRRHGRDFVPLHDLLPRASRHQARRERDQRVAI